MHHGAVVRVAGQQIGDDFAESFGKEAFVEVSDGLVDILFVGRHAPAVVAIRTQRIGDFCG